MDARDTPLLHDGRIVSYAGMGEDVVLRRFFGDQPTGFYVDVGAHDPLVGSVTLHFALSGWRGINIEPLLQFFSRLVELRPEDINLNLAVSDSPGTLELYVNRSEPGLTTATAELAEEYGRKGHRLERIVVPARPLAAVLAEHCSGKTIDFLKIDAEGHELQILRGMDLQASRPRVLLIEAGYRPEEWEPMVTGAGYLLAGSDPWNRYYVRSEESERASHFRCPANVSDDYITIQHVRALQEAEEWRSYGPLVRRIARLLNQAINLSPRAKVFFKKVVAKVWPRLLR